MKKQKRLITILLAIVMLLSSLMIPVQSIYANDALKLSKTTTITKIKTSYSFPQSTGSKETLPLYLHKLPNGDYIYCIEFLKPSESGKKMTAKDLMSSSAWKEMSSTAQKGVKYASAYGYPNYTYGVSTKAVASATQLIIWEYQMGYRTKADANNMNAGLNNDRFYKYCAKKYDDVLKAYKGIIKSIANQSKKPSFNNKSYTLPYSSSAKKYTLTITDSNGVLENFNVKSSNKKVTVKKSGNKLTISSVSKISNVSITCTKIGTDEENSKYGNAVALYYNSNHQVLIYGSVPCAVTSSITVSADKDATLQLIKTCTEGGSCKKHISGIPFTITCSALNYNKTVKTDSNGKILLSDLKPDYTYTVTEVVPGDCTTPTVTANGTTTTAKSIKVKLSAGKVSKVSFKNNPVLGTLDIQKIDSITKKSLKGAEFTVYTASGSPYAKLITNDLGKASLKNIPAGTYTLKETKAPEGYILKNYSRTFTINGNKKSFTYTIGNSDHEEHPKGIAYFFKYDKGTEQTKSGAVFDIYTAEDIYSAKNIIEHKKGTKVNTVITDETGFGESDELFIGKYYAVEVKAPNGYKINPEPQYFEIKTDEVVYNPNTSVDLGDAREYISEEIIEPIQPDNCTCCEVCTGDESCSCTCENCTCITLSEIPEIKPIEYTYGSATVNVVNAKSASNKVWGATVSCYYTDRDGKDILLGTGITGDNGKITFSNLAVGVEYKFLQTENFNSNFMINSKVQSVTLTEDEREKSITITNNLSDTAAQIFSLTQVDVYDEAINVTLKKTDKNTLKGLSDALIYVYNKNEELVYYGLTDENGEFRISAIPAGTYTFEERIAPSGYIKTDEKFIFTVKEDGTIEGTTEFDNAATEVTLTKTDITTAEGLPGARFIVWDSEDNEVANEITKEDGTVTLTGLPAGDYTWKETEAPLGYKLNDNTYSFTINEDGTISGDTVLTDYQTEVTIAKSDAVTAEAVPGAEITIFDSNGNEIASGITDENGQVTFYKLPQNATYTWKETKSPSGYLLHTEEYTFTIDSNGNINGDTSLQNTPNEWIIYKYDEDKNPLADALIGVYDESGNIIIETRSDGNGKIVLNYLVPGNYIFKELEAPKGYNLNSTVYKFVVNNDGTISGDSTIINTAKEGTAIIKTNHHPITNEKVKTGSALIPWVIAVIGIISFCTALILYKKRKQVNNK